MASKSKMKKLKNSHCLRGALKNKSLKLKRVLFFSASQRRQEKRKEQFEDRTGCDMKLSVRELKEFVRDLPEVDEYGDDFEVWIGGENGLSNCASYVMRLNKGNILINK